MTPKAQRKLFLPPWKMILNTTGFHGDVSREEISDILRDKPKGTYIITNYDPNDKRNQMFVIAMRAIVNNETTTLWTRGFTTHIEDLNQEYVDEHPPKTQHPTHCFYAKMKPLTKKTTFTLKEWCRATICESHSYEQIKILENKNFIPRKMSDYVTRHASTKTASSRTHILCEHHPLLHAKFI